MGPLPSVVQGFDDVVVGVVGVDLRAVLQQRRLNERERQPG